MKRYLALVLLLSTLTHAVSMSKEQAISNYIYNFALHTTWPKEIKNNNFEIYLLSSNKKLSSTFKTLVKKQRLEGKEIKIIRGTSSEVPYTAQLVYVDTKYLSQYQKIYNTLENRPVLMVSNGYDNKRLVMINLTNTGEKKVHFELNKANILNQRLGISPKLILLGGTELDVAKLYKGAQDSLLQKEKELQSQVNKAQGLEKDISRKNTELKDTQKRVEKLHSEMKTYEDDISSIQKQLKQQKEILENEKASTKKIRDDYAKANTQLDQMSSKLISQKQKLTTQEKEVEEKENKLSTLTQKVIQKAIEFEKLQGDLANQDIQIVDQGKIIDIQKDLLLVSMLAAFIFLVLGLIIFITLRREHKTNSKLKDTQVALTEQVKKTEKANASKTKFLAHMSHELRTPLNAVLGYSQLLQKDHSMSSENQKILATINRSGEHLLALINDVLEISKIETGHINIDAIAFDFYQFLDDIYSMFATRVSMEGLNLELIKDQGLPKFISADINKIRQIFINILSNSIKFTSIGGITIRVGHNLKESRLLIEIEDTGKGIEGKEITKLFKPFTQTISGKLDGGGAGLGLSIVQEYIHLMGGTINVTSKAGYGTVVHFELPYEEAQGSEAISQEFKEVLSLKDEDKGTEILIADDNVTNNELMTATLERVGFKVIAVENGFEALRLFKKIRPKMVLLDIEMPVMDGHKAAKEIRSLEYGKDVAILAVTALVFGMDKKKLLESDFNSLIRKPFKDYEVYEEIRRSLGVEYIYNEDKKSNKTQKVSLDALELNFKEALIKAASAMKISAINELITKVEDEFPKEAEYMKKLAHNFDYETLITILKK